MITVVMASQCGLLPRDRVGYALGQLRHESRLSRRREQCRKIDGGGFNFSAEDAGTKDKMRRATERLRV